MTSRPQYHKILNEKKNADGTVSYTLKYRSELFKQAACVGLDTELFFPIVERDFPEPAVKKMCSKCPIMNTCLEWGLAHERYGIWGGTTVRTRNTIRRLKGWVVNEINLPKPRI